MGRNVSRPHAEIPSCVLLSIVTHALHFGKAPPLSVVLAARLLTRIWSICAAVKEILLVAVQFRPKHPVPEAKHESIVPVERGVVHAMEGCRVHPPQERHPQQSSWQEFIS